MSPILPNIISSPAIIQWNGASYFSKRGIRVDFRRETFRVVTDVDGQIDERARIQYSEITFQPDGQLSNPNHFFPYTVSDVGRSIFGTIPKPLVILTKFGGASNTGQRITYPRAAISKLPQLRLKCADTLFGPMAFMTLGVPDVQPMSTQAWQGIENSVFNDTSFDEAAIITDIYSASFGAAPYDAMGSLAGFEVDVVAELGRIVADDFGLADLVLKSLTATARFTPSSLTEEQVYSLLSNQGANYVHPGQSISKSNTNLVISGSGNSAKTLKFTLNHAGPRKAGFLYNTSRHRFDAIEFTSRRTWNSGVANPLFTLVLS